MVLRGLAVAVGSGLNEAGGSPMTTSPRQRESLNRRTFLAGVAGTTATTAGGLFSGGKPGAAAESQIFSTLKNAIYLGDKFVSWQSPYGGPDPKKCPYRTPGKFDAFHMHG